MYKAPELRTKSREELLKLISELKGKLLALRFESATGQLSETHLPSITKKDIALIFTVLKEKELGIEISTKSKPNKNIEPTIVKEIKKPIVENKEEVKTTISQKTTLDKKVETKKTETVKKETKPVVKKPAKNVEDHATIIIDGLVDEGKNDHISIESHSSTIDNTDHHIKEEKDVK